MKQSTQTCKKILVQADLCVMRIPTSFSGTPVYMSSPLFIFHRTAVITAHHCADPETVNKKKKKDVEA